VRIRRLAWPALKSTFALSFAYDVIISGGAIRAKRRSSPAMTPARLSGIGTFRSAATKLIGSKASSGTAGHPGPTCLDSGGECDGRKRHQSIFGHSIGALARLFDMLSVG